MKTFINALNVLAHVNSAQHKRPVLLVFQVTTFTGMIA